MIRKLTSAVAAALLITSGAAVAQEESHSKILRDAQWNPVATEGHCRLRVWVDDRARIGLRADEIRVQTQSGARAYDQGSYCNQPLPMGPVEDFRVTSERGRGGIERVQTPNRRNDFTGSVVIDDPQNGGAIYVIDIAWRNDGRATDPLARFDDVRACQDQVRTEFERRNRNGAYIEFVGRTGRDEMGRNRDRLRGDALAHNRYVTRPVTYECVLNERTNVVENVDYRYPEGTAGGVR